tara:strand:- start:2926 stop:3471 length:546 start_codon:yes stop_codon:yes gene_type:complete
MKSIIINTNKPIQKSTEKPPPKTREKIINLPNDISQNIIQNINNHQYQLNIINKLYLDETFPEKKFIISELKSKISSYKQQDIKKTIHEKDNLISIDDVIEKLVSCKLKCYYCNKNTFIFFDKVRDSYQWTLDRLNNLDEHTSDNTIISCLKCNLERRRKNSEKFKFTKQLETNIIKIKKL